MSPFSGQAKTLTGMRVSLLDERVDSKKEYTATIAAENSYSISLGMAYFWSETFMSVLEYDLDILNFSIPTTRTAEEKDFLAHNVNFKNSWNLGGMYPLLDINMRKFVAIVHDDQENLNISLEDKIEIGLGLKIKGATESGIVMENEAMAYYILSDADHGLGTKIQFALSPSLESAFSLYVQYRGEEYTFKDHEHSSFSTEFGLKYVFTLFGEGV